MKILGSVLADILRKIRAEIKPGVDSMSLEKSFLRLCHENGVNPACKGYSPYNLPPFPTGLCLSINNESVHCFPKEGKIIQEGDLVTVDTVIEKDGLHMDAAFSVGVGNVTPNKEQLLKACEKAMYNAIDKVKDGVRVGVLSHAMETTIRLAGFNVIRDFAGHGIGLEMHEYPEIPCFGIPSEGAILKEGMTICVECLVCEGEPEIKSLGFWETKMKDGKNFLQFEHTVLVTKKGYEIITA